MKRENSLHIFHILFDIKTTRAHTNCALQIHYEKFFQEVFHILCSFCNVKCVSNDFQFSFSGEFNELGEKFMFLLVIEVVVLFIAVLSVV